MTIITIKQIQRFTVLSFVYPLSACIFAAEVPPKSSIVDLTPEIIRQDQRIVELEKKMGDENLLLTSQLKIKTLTRDSVLVTEDPCFEIQQLKFTFNDPLQSYNQNIFNRLFHDLNQPNFIVGQCVGTQSLKSFVRYAQNELIKQGLITTQIIVNPQDLAQGLLILNLQVGRINQIISKDQSVSKLEIFNALPIKNNEILNLKHIDQGLENLKRISNRDVDI